MSNRAISNPDLGLLVIRVMLAVVFLFHGAQKLFGVFGGYGISGTADFMDSIGLPLPVVSAVLAGVAEFFGGIALLTGWAFRWAAAALAFTMMVASFSAHSGFSGANGMEFPLTLAAVAAGLVLAGPGRHVLPFPRIAAVRTAS